MEKNVNFNKNLIFCFIVGGETGIVMQIRICPTSPAGTEFKPINSKYIYKVDSFPLQSG